MESTEMFILGLIITMIVVSIFWDFQKSRGKTKPIPSELGISNNQWNNKLTKAEKAAKEQCCTVTTTYSKIITTVDFGPVKC